MSFRNQFACDIYYFFAHFLFCLFVLFVCFFAFAPLLIHIFRHLKEDFQQQQQQPQQQQQQSGQILFKITLLVTSSTERGHSLYFDSTNEVYSILSQVQDSQRNFI
jgi:hypothetical protein